MIFEFDFLKNSTVFFLYLLLYKTNSINCADFPTKMFAINLRWLCIHLLLLFVAIVFMRILCAQDMVSEVQRMLCISLSEFSGSLEDESDLEILIEHQFEVLQKALKIPHKASEARIMVSKKFLTLFRTGKLGPVILDDVPDASDSVS